MHTIMVKIKSKSYEKNINRINGCNDGYEL